MIKDHELLQFIEASGLVSRKDIEESKNESEERGLSLSDVLLNKGVMQEDELRRVEAHVLGLPFVSLTGRFIPSDILSIIPEPIARTRNIIAYHREGGKVEVALLLAEDLARIEHISRERGFTFLPRLTDSASMRHALLQYHKHLKDEYGRRLKEEAHAVENLTGAVLNKEVLERTAKSPQAMRVFDILLRHALSQGASHIHIEEGGQMLLVRYRIGGVLYDALELSPKIAVPLSARVKMLSDVDISARIAPQEGRFRIETEEEVLSVRVSILPTLDGEKIVLRLLHESAEGFTLESLGLSGKPLDHLLRSLYRRKGMVLVTGPSGSGVTTTLYTMLDLLNLPSLNTATIENPVEYRMPRVNQVQVKEGIGLDMENGLRALLRQDPDVVLVGNIEDKKTAELALRGASHSLVIAGMEAKTAGGAIERLLDMGIDHTLVSSSLSVVLNQRLARTLLGGEKFPLEKRHIARLEKVADIRKVESFMRGEGIIKQNVEIEELSLFKETSREKEGGGHIGAFEVLSVTEPLKEYIRQDRNATSIQRQAEKEGMLTFAEGAVVKAMQGTISFEEVFRVAK